MKGRISTIEEFIETYEVFLQIEEMKRMGLTIKCTDHYEGILVDMLDFLGTTSVEMENEITMRKPKYIAVAVVRSDLLKALDAYQRESEEDEEEY